MEDLCFGIRLMVQACAYLHASWSLSDLMLAAFAFVGRKSAGAVGVLSWWQDECVAEPLLSGCVMEQPCQLPDLGPVPCMCGSPGRPREAQGPGRPGEALGDRESGASSRSFFVNFSVAKIGQRFSVFSGVIHDWGFSHCPCGGTTSPIALQFLAAAL